MAKWKFQKAKDVKSISHFPYGTLWAWGSNSQGQLGDGTTVNKSSPVQVGALTVKIPIRIKND